MKIRKALFLFFIFNLSAQQKPIETIYFDFDKFDLTNDKQKLLRIL